MTETERYISFEQIFKSNYKKLYLYAVYLIDDSEPAKDLVCDTFAWVWENYESVELKNIDSYLFMSVKNKCLDYLHHKHIVNRYAELYVELDRIEKGNRNDYDERIDRIIELIKGMPPQTRFIMEQCYLHEKTYKEVADVMNMSVSGVRKHIIKGLMIIRKDFSVNYKKGVGLKTN